MDQLGRHLKSPSSVYDSSKDCDTGLSGITGCAGIIGHTTGGATFVAPNGTFQIDDDACIAAVSACPASGSSSGFFGALMSQNIIISDHVLWTTDMSGTGSSASAKFNQLKSWKDQ